MKPEHRRTAWENEEFGSWRRWLRSTPRLHRRIKKKGHRMDRAAAKQAIAQETRWAGGEDGWTE